MEHVNIKELGQALKAIRVGNDVAVEIIAKRLNCTEKAINHIENGDVKGFSTLFWKYCVFLKVDIIFDIDETAYWRGINKLRFTNRN